MAYSSSTRSNTYQIFTENFFDLITKKKRKRKKKIQNFTCPQNTTPTPTPTHDLAILNINTEFLDDPEKKTENPDEKECILMRLTKWGLEITVLEWWKIRNFFSLCFIDRRRTPPSQGFIIGNNPQCLNHGYTLPFPHNAFFNHG